MCSVYDCMSKGRRGNGRSTCWALRGMAIVIAKGLLTMGSINNRAQKAADETVASRPGTNGS